MIITIGGEPGSGKSTVANIVAQKLGYKHYSTGDLRGEIAMRHGLTIDELNEIGKRELWTDKECDDRTVEIGEEEDNVVFDSWLAWHFIPKSLKVFLTVDKKEAARRVFAHQRKDEKRQKTAEGVSAMLQKRYIETNERYKKWYHVDITDLSHYDLVIDATSKKPEELADEIVAFSKTFK